MLQGQNEMCFNAEKPIAFVCNVADPVSWPDFIFFIQSLIIYNCSQVPVLLHIAHNIIFLHGAIFSFLFFTHVCLDVVSVKDQPSKTHDICLCITCSFSKWLVGLGKVCQLLPGTVFVLKSKELSQYLFLVPLVHMQFSALFLALFHVYLVLVLYSLLLIFTFKLFQACVQ